MAISNAFDQFETLIRENLGNALINLEIPEVDDPALRLIETFTDLGPGGRNEDGNGYQARRKLKLSRGGMITGGTWDGNDIIAAGTSDVLPIGQTANALAPDPEEVPLTQYETIKTNLKRMIGNVTVNMQQVLADLMSDEIENVAMGHIEDAVFHNRHNLTAWFYGRGDSTISEAGETITLADGVPAAVALNNIGPFGRFIKGQRYTAFDGGTGSNEWNNATPEVALRSGGKDLICVDWDDNNRKVILESVGGATDLEPNDPICLKGTQTVGATPLAGSLVPRGVEYMFKESGEFFGISDVADFPQLIAYVEGSEDSMIQPEPEAIAEVYDKISNARTLPPTLFISERSVQTQYAFLEKAGYAQYTVPQMMPQASGGVSGAVFNHGNLVVPWEVSAMIRKNSLLGISPETIHKFAPGGANTVRWWNARGSGAGISSIFIPVTSGVQQTELWQAPFETHCDFMCIEPKRNFRFLGLISQETA